MDASDAGALNARFHDLFAKTAALGSRADAARQELATAMGYVVLSRTPRTAFMNGSQAAMVLTAMAGAAGLDPAELTSVAPVARDWTTRRTPLVAELQQRDVQQLQQYVELFTEAVDLAAQIEPVDLPSVSAAALLAAAQSTALPGAIPVGDGAPSSVVPRLHPVTQASAQATPDVETESAPVESLEDLYAELDALVGLVVVKEEIRQQAELLRVQKLRVDAGLAEPGITRHLVFTGNPGTGKTTIARLVSRIYRAIGVLPKGHLVEVDKTGLVAGYLGQSEEKTAGVIQDALGGVLFIDEAYSLTSDDYGRTVVDVLVKAAEDMRRELVIILAGYTGPMSDFIDMNPGLASRFRTVIEFPDYSDAELVTIFERIVEKSDYECEPDAFAAFAEMLDEQVHDETFGNARFARNCFEAAIVRHAWRLRDVPAPTVEQLVTLTREDVAGPASVLVLPPVEGVTSIGESAP